MMLVEETFAPVGALQVAILKDHMRLGSGFSDDGVQDSLLETTLRAAMATIEARTGKILIERGFLWTVTGWRDDYRQPLPLAPVSAIASMVLIDRNGGEVVADVASYRLEPDTHRPALMAAGGFLPAIPPHGSVRIGLLAGFGPEWSDVPADLAQAVLMLATHFYEYRHDLRSGNGDLPFGVAALISPYRNVRVFGGVRS